MVTPKSVAALLLPLLLLQCALPSHAAEGLTADSDYAALLEATLKALPGADTGGCAKDCKAALKLCLDGQDVGKPFAAGVHNAIEQMMQQRNKKMRRGIFHLSSAVIALAGAAEPKCGKELPGIAVLRDVAKRLHFFTEKMGYVEYKVKEQLKVSGVDCHKPLNNLIGQWKKSPSDAVEFGKAMGEFLGPFKDAVAAKTKTAEL